MANKVEKPGEHADIEQGLDKKIMNNDWKNVLNYVNLANVQVYTDRAKGNIPIMSETLAKARQNNLAQVLARRNDFKSKFLLLTGEQT